ncbi:MAG: hypothetical protein WEC59_01305 [Salibacteraceae bacterium]
MKTSIYILSLILLNLYAQAQERSFTVDLDRESILIGEHINMRVQLKSATTDSMVFPIIGDTIIKEIEVVSKEKIDTAFVGDHLEQRVLSQNITVTSFDSGYYAIPPLKGMVSKDTVESNPFLIAVGSVKIDMDQGIADIKPIEEISFPLKEWLATYWHWIVIALVLVGLITYIALWFSKQKPKEKVEEEIIIPSRPAHEIALERLETLKSTNYWQTGDFKRYYSELTNILRAYIEGQFGISALEQTTNDIVRTMQHHPDFEKPQIDDVRKVLFLADLVKFAKEKPTAKENEINLELVEQFVKNSSTSIPEKEEHPTNENNANNG